MEHKRFGISLTHWEYRFKRYDLYKADYIDDCGYVVSIVKTQKGIQFTPHGFEFIINKVEGYGR